MKHESICHIQFTLHKNYKAISKIRKNGEMDYLKPDGKAQVTVEYVDDFPIRIDSILISTQHSEKYRYTNYAKKI